MSEMLAYCGLDCGSCPAYVATQEGDMEGLGRVATEWSEDYGMEIKPEDILCDGCKSDTGRINSYCAICPISKCARERGFPNCAHCGDYPCEKLTYFPPFEDEAKPNLDAIRDAMEKG